MECAGPCKNSCIGFDCEGNAPAGTDCTPEGTDCFRLCDGTGTCLDDCVHPQYNCAGSCHISQCNFSEFGPNPYPSPFGYCPDYYPCCCTNPANLSLVVHCRDTLKCCLLGGDDPDPTETYDDSPICCVPDGSVLTTCGSCHPALQVCCKNYLGYWACFDKGTSAEEVSCP